MMSKKSLDLFTKMSHNDANFSIQFIFYFIFFYIFKHSNNAIVN